MQCGRHPAGPPTDEHVTYAFGDISNIEFMQWKIDVPNELVVFFMAAVLKYYFSCRTNLQCDRYKRIGP